MNWYTAIVRDISKIPDAISHYESELADAKNPDVWFLKAVYYSKSGDNKAAFDCLKKSAQLGFSDINRLKNENSFASLKKTIEYQNLILNTVLLNSEKY